jgi:hypothetical protein
MTTTTQHVTIGTKNGVEWVCYHEGESDREYAAKLEAMMEAFRGTIEISQDRVEKLFILTHSSPTKCSRVSDALARMARIRSGRDQARLYALSRAFNEQRHMIQMARLGNVSEAARHSETRDADLRRAVR